MSFNQRVKNAIPNSLRRALSRSLRPFGAPLRLQSLLAFDGAFSLPLDDKAIHFEYANRWIERDLFWQGWKGYEPVSMDLWRRACPSARTVIDIGANSGLYSLVAKVLNPSARVLAFEPLPMFADALERNAELNNVRVELIRAAVSDTDSRAQFFVPEELAGNIYSSTLSRAHYEEHQHSHARVLDVDVVRFDAFAEREGVLNIDLVKIDAEGHDAMVVEGMQRTIETYAPDFLIEVQNDVVGSRMMPFFDATRYAYFNLSEMRGPRRAIGLGRSETVNFFVCKHETVQRLGLS